MGKAGADCCADKHGTTIANELKTTTHATGFIDGAIAFHVVIRMIRRGQILSEVDQENSIGEPRVLPVPTIRAGPNLCSGRGTERLSCGTAVPCQAAVSELIGGHIQRQFRSAARLHGLVAVFIVFYGALRSSVDENGDDLLDHPSRSICGYPPRGC